MRFCELVVRVTSQTASAIGIPKITKTRKAILLFQLGTRLACAHLRHQVTKLACDYKRWERDRNGLVPSACLCALQSREYQSGGCRPSTIASTILGERAQAESAGAPIGHQTLPASRVRQLTEPDPTAGRQAICVRG